MTLATKDLEALEQWRQSDFDLILMDVQMPEMTGLQATAQIRQEEAI
jgi:CheY-like chemotaxis protein